jgi:alkylation response protein AidB-like acyl-CoA dehydrogenase
MTDFGLPPRVEALLPTIRAVVEDELWPLERRMLLEGFGAILPELDALRASLRGRGLWLPQIAAEHGGMGFSLVEFAYISELLGQSILGHYALNCQAPDAGNMEVLLEYATPAQRERFLEPLLSGHSRSCFGMTEPEFAGSNPTRLGTTAVLDGDHWVLNGHKWFMTGADGAAFCVVMAVTDPDAAPHARASQIIVPLDTPGFQLVENIAIMGERGEAWASHAEVRLMDCRVPQENVLGRRGAGFMIAQQRLGPGRIHHCMRWLGICERAFGLMCERAATRELGEGELLGGKQLVQAWIAESRAEIDAARLLVLRTAWRIEHEGAKAARQDISLIKFYTAGVLQRVLDRAIQTHGALGITDHTPLAFWWRHERGARIYDGADEVHKVSAARDILRGYGVKERG